LTNNLEKYNTIFLDCDGVILDSNRIKSEAFYDIALPYGKNIAESLVEYNKEHGGISRLEKIRYMAVELLGLDNPDALIQTEVRKYGQLVIESLSSCSLTEGLIDFLKRNHQMRSIYVLSGGLESELKDVFQRRDLSKYFISIFGSPKSKIDILKEIMTKYDNKKCLFIGDSRYDYEVSDYFKIDFIFMSMYTELTEWEKYTKSKNIRTVKNLRSL